MNALINDLCAYFGCPYKPHEYVFFGTLADVEEKTDRVVRAIEWDRMMFGAVLDIVNANQPGTTYKPWLRHG